MLNSENKIRDLGIPVTSDINWNTHNKRIAKVNSVLCLLQRNIADNVSTRAKAFLYKSLILPILFYGFQCIYLSNSNVFILEKFQKEVVKRICGTGSFILTDQNAEYTLATNIHIVTKLVATFTALKRTTKQNRATTNTGYVITIEWTLQTAED